MKALISAVALGAALSPTAVAQRRPAPPRVSEAPPPAAINPALLQALEYRSIGPFRGGRSTAVAGVPGQPLTFYMG